MGWLATGGSAALWWPKYGQRLFGRDPTLLVFHDRHKGGEDFLHHFGTHPAHAICEPHGIYASSLEHVCGRCLRQTILLVRLDAHLPDVAGKAVVPARNRHN